MLVNKVDTIKFFNQTDAQMPVPLLLKIVSVQLTIFLIFYVYSILKYKKIKI